MAAARFSFKGAAPVPRWYSRFKRARPDRSIKILALPFLSKWQLITTSGLSLSTLGRPPWVVCNLSQIASLTFKAPY